MRIGIIGAGAIGCVVGGLLTKAGHDVTLVDQWPEHVETMKRRGLKLSGTCGEHTIRVKALHIHELQGVSTSFDAVFVSVKSYDTEWAAQMALAYLEQPDGVVVDFQNGVNDERVATVVGKARCLGCVITIGAGMYEPGHAMRTDSGSVGFKIGDLGDTMKTVEEILQKRYEVSAGKARVATDMVDIKGVEEKENERKALEQAALADFLASQGVQTAHVAEGPAAVKEIGPKEG